MPETLQAGSAHVLDVRPRHAVDPARDRALMRRFYEVVALLRLFLEDVTLHRDGATALSLMKPIMGRAAVTQLRAAPGRRMPADTRPHAGDGASALNVSSRGRPLVVIMTDADGEQSLANPDPLAAVTAPGIGVAPSKGWDGRERRVADPET